MDIPINHHYVSQCQSRHFFNTEEKKIYLYDKELKNFYPKQSTKTLFSEERLNSKIVNGKVDDALKETDLKVNFEDPYFNFVQTILNGIEAEDVDESFKEALIGVTKIGIIGEFRNPKYKTNFQDGYLKYLDIVKEKGADKFRRSIDKLKQETESVKYLNWTDHLAEANEILNRMGSINYKIFVTKSNDHFILPDCSAFTMRERINDYGNPYIQEIAIVGIPITDKVFVQAVSNKLHRDFDQIEVVTENNSETIFDINLELANASYKAIACKSQDFLKNFIRKATETRL